LSAPKHLDRCLTSLGRAFSARTSSISLSLDALDPNHAPPEIPVLLSGRAILCMGDFGSHILLKREVSNPALSPGIVYIVRLHAHSEGVGLATGRLVSKVFSSPEGPDRLWGSAQIPNQWVPGAPSSGVKQPERESDHSPPASAEVKKM
jgi:hypothetical protein